MLSLIVFFFFFEYGIYLEKVFTLNSMAASLDYVEGKQSELEISSQEPIIPVGRLKSFLRGPWGHGQAQDPSWLLGSEFGHSETKSYCRLLSPQPPALSSCCGGKYIVDKTVLAEISKNPEMKILATNSINIVVVN